MSQENLAVVGRCFELFGRGEVEVALRYVDPAETNAAAELPGAANFAGTPGSGWPRTTGQTMGGLPH
jgi:hypothetical protein